MRTDPSLHRARPALAGVLRRRRRRARRSTRGSSRRLSAQSWFYDVVGASAVVVALIGIHVNRPDRRLPWFLMATGQALFVAGDIMWNYYEAIGEAPFPSIADVLYLAGYPFIAAGLLLLIRRRLGDGDRGGILDAAILTTAVAILSWTFLIQPLVVGSELDPLSLAISLAYPLADLLLIGVAMGLLTTPGARTPSFRLLGLSLVALLVADQIYALQNLDGTYVAGGPLDSIYLIAYILFGRRGAPPVDGPPHRPAPGRRHVARPGPDGLPGRRHDHRAAAGHDRPGRRRRAGGRGARHGRSCRCSSSSAWPASSGCSTAT